MATVLKHKQRSKVTSNRNTEGKRYFFAKCEWYADLRRRAKEQRKKMKGA